MSNISDSVISALIITIGLIIIAIVAGGRIDQNMRNQAVDGCMKISIVEWKSQSGAGSNLVPEWLKTCMQKKGYE